MAQHKLSRASRNGLTLREQAALQEKRIYEAIVATAAADGVAQLADVLDLLESRDHMPPGGAHGVTRRLPHLMTKGLVKAEERGHRVRGHNLISSVRVMGK